MCPNAHRCSAVVRVSSPYIPSSRDPIKHTAQVWQEGRHPLTGQRAANFSLLANQWAERRLVTQWHHGCRAMRRSVCNAGASNGGRSLCVQISRERSYLLQIYWYHSKGNWLRYNLRGQFLYNGTLQQTFRPLLSKLSKRRQATAQLTPLMGGVSLKLFYNNS